MKNTVRTNYQEKLFRIAKNAKNALIDEWEKSDSENKYFKDNDSMKKKGVLPEGIGATALLLLFEAFGNEPEVFSAADKAKVTEIANRSLKNLESWTKGGYVATPLLPSSCKAFNTEYGYTDTITWCLPSAILARYAEYKQKLRLDDDVRNYVFDAIAKGIKTLCESQVNGQWGFRSDTESPRSLYYTYSAAAAIADFFDYVMGEIALLDVGEGEDEDEAIKNAADKELIKYLESVLGDDIIEKVKDARAALQNWLIREALPLLPKIASCVPLDDGTLAALGMWKHSTVDIDGEGEQKAFHHLYYTFYLLDMMVTAGVDQRFSEMLESVDTMRELAKHYEENKRLNETDLFYFFYDRKFEKDDILNGDYHYEELFNKNVECALYAARAQYAVASKTGMDFWNMAELPLTLSHPNKVVSSAIPSSNDFKDPSVVAMALRSSITYSYYVTETQDIAVERLFDDMCAEIFTEAYKNSIKPAEDDDNYDAKLAEYEDKIESCIENLWDCENYSLALTERSIEALVDFKDYLDKFYAEDTAGAASAGKKSSAAASPFEIALEQKIEDYLRSEAGKKIVASHLRSEAGAEAVANYMASGAGKDVITALIRNELKNSAVSAAPIAPAATASSEAPAAVSSAIAMPDKETLADEISAFVSSIKKLKKVNPDGMEDEKLSAALVMLYRELATLDVKDALSAWYTKDSDVKNYAKIYDERKKKLFEALAKDLTNNDKSFDTLYEDLITLIKRADL